MAEWEAEEIEAMERERRRCRAENERLLALRGDDAAAEQVKQGCEPLLRRHGPPPVLCVPPYDAPNLLP